MYGKILAAVLALALFELKEPGGAPFAPPLETLLWVLGGTALQGFLSLALFRRAAHAGGPSAFARAEFRGTALALLALAFDVYTLDVKHHLAALPGFAKTMTVSGLAALTLLFFHLGVMWAAAAPFRPEREHEGGAVWVVRQAAFLSALLIPWLLISAASDALSFLPLPPFLREGWGSLALLALSALLFILVAPALIVRLWRCRPLPDSPALRTMRAFAAAHGFRVAGFFDWPVLGRRALTAAILGLIPRWRYILATPGLLAILDPPEAAGVLAHEMGHARRLHVPFFLLLLACWSVLATAAEAPLLLLSISNPTLLALAVSPDAASRTLFAVATNLPVVALLFFYIRYVFGYFLRNCEREADLFALRLLGTPGPLITSFRKIAWFSGIPATAPSWHHFSIAERIEALEKAATDPSRIPRHSRRLYGAAAGLVAAVALAGWGAGAFEGSAAAGVIRAGAEARLIERAIERGGERPELLAALGGALQAAGRYEEAKRALDRALVLSPDDPTALNNLAWLKATAPEPWRDPAEALALAGRAARLDPRPHVLDTLAEALFVNGRAAEALAAIERALALPATPEREHLLRQRERFRQALTGGG